jgi:hypothetical protein
MRVLRTTRAVWGVVLRARGCAGPITQLSLAGDHVVVLSDPADAEELVRHASFVFFIEPSCSPKCTPARTPVAQLLLAETTDLRGEIPVQQQALRHAPLRAHSEKAPRGVHPDVAAPE